jgi:tryptophanyl-tRNA synthetase
MECTASFGELSRMTQFKDKSARSEFVSAGLFTYPALMAADILLYQADQVPVGEDQKQHLELARTLATRFNTRYGKVFTVPEPQIPEIGARVMDLQLPSQKMSKSSSHDAGIIYLLDPPEIIKKKVARAVTDSHSDLRYVTDDPSRAGLRNLLELTSALSGRGPEEIATEYATYGSLKGALSDRLAETLLPIQERYQLYVSDRGELLRLLKVGAERAHSVANATVRRASDALGFLTPSNS